MNKIFIITLSIISFVFGTLISPSNGEDLRSIHVLFEWAQVPDAVSYDIQISNSNSFNSILTNINEISTIYIDKDNLAWDNSYYWRIRPVYDSGNYGQWSDSSYFSINQSVLTELDVSIYNEELIQDGLIMYSQFAPYFAVGVIDKFGNEIWNTEIAYMNHMNSYGELYGVNNSGGVKFNFHHEILWSTLDGVSIDVHEVKQIPNGNYMAFVPTYQLGPIPPGDWSIMFQAQGYQVDGVTNEFPWVGMRVVEFDKDTSEEVWSWEPFEHFTIDDYDLYESIWWQAAFDGVFDWMHTNAFHFDEEEGAIYTSHRHLSRISKIAYPSGDVIWNMGLLAEYNTGENNICTELGFSFQHHIQLLDNGDLLFFDNGNLSDIVLGDSNPTSRIRRIRVVDNSYCETVWQYDLPQNLYGFAMGSVQLLENGNYSIYTFGNGLNESECSILEVTPVGDIIWKATSQDPNAAWYRSYKIPSMHPDAFSVLANGYTVDENNSNIIQILGNSLNFTIYNKSSYTQPYKYSFGDLTDGPNPMFNYEVGNFILNPNESVELSFLIADTNVLSASIGLSVWAEKHNYAMKDLMFSVEVDNFLLGDVNNDGIVNVLDIVSTVNFVLSGAYNQAADTNADGEINILDVVIMVNIIVVGLP